MRNLLKSFQGIERKLAFVLAFIPICSIVGFLPYSVVSYYIILLVIWWYGIFNYSVYINLQMFLLLFTIIVGLLLNSPPAFFRTWERFLYFILVAGVVSPLFLSRKLIKIRFYTFQWLLYFSCFISIVSFCGYFFGVNYMRSFNSSISNNAVGWFGGITIHSMLLGPISAVSTIFLLWIFLIKKKILLRTKLFLSVTILFSLFSVILTSSRGSFFAVSCGIFSLLFLNFRKSFSKLFKILSVVFFLAFVSFPVYEPLARNLIKKQRDNVEAGGSFASRQSKWNNRIKEFNSSPLFGIGFAAIDITNSSDYKGGTIEPGSSWLAVLSMTGILGGILILSLLFSCYCFLFNNLSNDSILLLSLLNLFVVHMMTEGYIFAAGSFMFFYFWLLIGIIQSLKFHLYSFNFKNHVFD